MRSSRSTPSSSRGLWATPTSRGPAESLTWKTRPSGMPGRRRRERAKSRPALNTSRSSITSVPSMEPPQSPPDLHPYHSSHSTSTSLIRNHSKINPFNQQTTRKEIFSPSLINFKDMNFYQFFRLPFEDEIPQAVVLALQSEYIIQNMSLVQEFVEQQLSKSLSSTITHQLQICHSAVEDLLANLESLRSGPKLEIIRSKISRISVFLEAKQEVLKLIQAEEDQPLIEWLIHEKLDSPLLVELVRQEQRFVEEMLRKTIKNIFLSGEKLEGYLEENELVSNCLSLLRVINEELAIGRTPTRDKLMNVDSLQGVIWERVIVFENKVALFNREIARVIDQLYEFQNSLSQQFRLFFSKDTQSKNSPLKSRLEAFERTDQIFEENAMNDPTNKSYDHEYSRTQGGDSKFGGEYRQEALFRTGFPVRDNYTSKLRSRNEVSQLGINSQLVINASANKDKDRSMRSQLMAQTKSYFR